MPHWCAQNRKLLFLLLAIAVVLGAFEGTFARTFLSADGNSYLDVARLLRMGDFKTALNTYWGLGYPLLLACWLPLFPSTPLGEWIGVHILNLLILTATLFSFYSLVAAAYACVRKSEEVTSDERSFRWLLLFAFPVFITTQLYIDAVSRVSPDMLVSCLVFAAVGTLLRLSRKSSRRDAIILGLLLGAGYVVKGILLPLSILCILIELALLFRKKEGLRNCAISAVVFGVLAIPYLAGMSWSFGHRTFGEVGGLNYAWRVNNLQGDVFWQGGPSGYGKPERPARQVSTNPSVFLFDWPAHVTYGPWFDPPGYYYGYHHFFSMRNQMRATSANILTVFKLLRAQPVVYFLLFGLLLRRRSWRSWISASLHLWPMLVVSFAGFSAYLAILVYPRYLAAFTNLLFLFFCVMLFAGDNATCQTEIAPRTRTVIFTLMLLACLLDPIVRPREPYLDPVAHIRHHEFFWNDPEWRTAQYLARSGVQTGERVAVVKSDFLTGWAYLDHLQIIGQVGGEWLTPRIDETGIFWRSGPDRQAEILKTLHDAGAQLVVGFEKPADQKAVGWENVPGTDVWIYRRF